MQARTSPKKERNNTINAVIHENDLQNGTREEIKLWFWLGNTWILPGSNNGSTEAGSLIPEKEDDYGGFTAWRVSARIDIGSDDTGRFTFPAHTPPRDLGMTCNSSRPECDLGHFLHVLSRHRNNCSPCTDQSISGQKQVKLFTWCDLTNKALVQ